MASCNSHNQTLLILRANLAIMVMIIAEALGADITVIMGTMEMEVGEVEDITVVGEAEGIMVDTEEETVEAEAAVEVMVAEVVVDARHFGHMLDEYYAHGHNGAVFR